MAPSGQRNRPTMRYWLRAAREHSGETAFAVGICDTLRHKPDFGPSLRADSGFP